MIFLKNKPYIIAEIAQSHDGSLGLAHSYIDAVAASGASAIKFQTHIASEESTIREPWRVNFSYEDQTRFDYWKRMEFTESQWQGLAQHARDAGIDFVSSPFSLKAVEVLKKCQMPFWKIGSGEIDNIIMMDAILETKIPLVVSTGMSSYEEVDRVYQYLQSRNAQFALLHCTTEYPVKIENFGLNSIQEFKDRYTCPIGLSSHLPRLGPNLAAIALGAELLEIHVCFSRSMFGPDTSSSLTMEELKQLVEEAKLITQIQAHPLNKNQKALEVSGTRDKFRKSIVANADLSPGHVLRIEDLAFKKPGDGLPVSRYVDIVGKRLTCKKSKDDLIQLQDIE